MKTYAIPMVPGPVRVPEKISSTYRTDYGSGDLENDYFDLYDRTRQKLQRILGTTEDVVIQSGEGMLALWSALKSCILPGDRVLAVSTGVFGTGIGEMARAVQADVQWVEFRYNETIHDLDRIESAVAAFKPKMITAVHCETPSGTLNPIDGLGQIKKARNVPLLYVDAVASAGGTRVQADKWQVDLCLGGSQKCLSCPPDMSFVSVSQNAWDIIARVNYSGYDALKPFRHAVTERFFPYTPNWHGTASLHTGAQLLLTEGLETCFQRHAAVAQDCRRRLSEMGIELYPAADAIPSPTVSAAKVPTGFTWETWDAALRRRGLVVGGSLGPLAGKIFRLGHMGSQAETTLLDKALAVIEEALLQKRSRSE
ncbi:MAG: aminotransferase class V-fold PLP-dependent enzyme [Deltaproteobacteria bacterium]